MREVFEESLEELHQLMLNMGQTCQSIIASSYQALIKNDLNEIEQIHDYENKINHLERSIEAKCMQLLLLQAPVATDLRKVSSALKMITDMERIGDDPAAVEYDLGGADHVEASVSVDRTERPECLHHRLLTCLRVIDMVDHNIALPQYFLDISLSRFVMGAQISLIVRPDRNKTLPVVLRMHQDPVVLRLPEIKERFQDLVLDFNEL